MRIALVTSMKFGLTQFIMRDIEGLMARGADVRLFTLLRERGLYEPRPEWEVNEASGLRAVAGLLRLIVTRPALAFSLVSEAIKLGSIRDLAIAAHFASRLDADLIFAYFGDHKLFVGYYMHRITGLPLAVTVRAYELYRNPNERLFVEALGACSVVLTITEHNASVLRDRYEVESSRIRIVRQVVDLDLYRPRQVIKVLIVGYFAEKKGHSVLLAALSSLRDVDAELWVVGDLNPSILPVDVRAIARELGLDDRVAFFGTQSGTALRALYREADIFCLPSRRDRKGDHEGFPNVIAEAMAFGKPVVATRHAGIPEAIDRMLVEENDAEGLAAALRTVIESEALRRSMGDENRSRATEMFSPSNTDRLFDALSEARGSSQERG